MNHQDDQQTNLKLFMILLGSKAPGRHVEQHDFFFGIGSSLKELVPQIKAFWPEAGDKIHIDGWREVTAVDGHAVSIAANDLEEEPAAAKKLFFINLGGYQPNKLEEQHYAVLTVKDNKAAAFREAKDTLFYQTNHFPGGESHIDDRYGIDVDDLYQIEDILSAEQKSRYKIMLTPAEGLAEDVITLGYYKLDKL